MVPFEEAAPPASDAAIEELEARVGAELPSDYKHFLRRQNGGYLEPNSYGDDGEGASVRQLYTRSSLRRRPTPASPTASRSSWTGSSPVPRGSRRPTLTSLGAPLLA
jgi:SMI1 / KNR4 family (SUKH-1)